MIILTVPPVAVGKRNPTMRRIPHNMLNQRMHWATRNRWNKAWKEAVGWEWVRCRPRKATKIPGFAKIRVAISAIKPFDHDGAYSAAKPLIDGLKEAGAIMDDDIKHVDLEVIQKRVRHRDEEGVKIGIDFD